MHETVKSFINEKLKPSDVDWELGADPNGFIPGEFIHLHAPNQTMKFDFYMPMGKGSGMLFGFIFQCGKWGLQVKKFSEWSEVSPVHSQYYQLTTQQKQQLEGQIKQSLAGIQSSVADYELLSHDLRKYKEYMQYFEALERGKKEKDDELVKKTNATLKSIFIDQVDVHTGEGVALKLIVSRWPTIIVDFLKLKDDDADQKKISKDYNFSEAEGYVLATKNKLFVKWKELFKETVRSRYEKLLQLTDSRKKSIDEYRNIVKPYIQRYRAIREMGETEEGRRQLQELRTIRPTVQAVSLDMAEYWAYKPFFVPEIHKATAEAVSKDKVDIRKLPFPRGFKKILNKHWDSVEEDLKKQIPSPTGIEPLDKWVLHFANKMQDFYEPRVTITLKDLLKARQNLISDYTDPNKLWAPSPYFMVVDWTIKRSVMRYPDGREFENMIFEPFEANIDTQNMMLLRYLELILHEKENESYITDFLGQTTGGVELMSRLDEEFPFLRELEEKEKPKKKEKKGGKPVEMEAIKKVLPELPIPKISLAFKLVRGGPYEVNFIDRFAAMYIKELANLIYAPAKNFLKANAGVPSG